MNLTPTEKEKALNDLHAIPDSLQGVSRAADTLARINVNLDRIGDILETIADEMAREREELEAQHRTRQTAAGRTFNTISSERGRGE